MNFTDILKNFFVYKDTLKKSSLKKSFLKKSIKKSSNSIEKIDKESSENVKSVKEKSIKKENVKESKENVKESKESKENVKENVKSIKKESIKENVKENVKSYTSKYSTSESSELKETSKSESSELKETSKSASESSELKEANKSESRESSELKEASKSESKETSESSESESKESSKSSESESKESSKSKVSKVSKVSKISSVIQFEMKKMVLKACEFYKKNILIANNNFNLELVCDLLDKLSNMKNVENIYDKTIHVYTFSENKKYFKEILLDNPDLYFNNFNIKSKLNLKELDGKRKIVIVESELVPIEDIEKLNALSIHLIVLSSSYSESLKIYKVLDNCLLLNQKDSGKLLQKGFFFKVIKNIVKGVSYDNYTRFINSNNIKNIIIKNKELKYTL
jgi:hypothetical protein